MSLDVFNPLASDQNVVANAARDLPAGFSEAFDISTREISEWRGWGAYNNARERSLATFYDGVKAQTGVQLPLYGMGGNVGIEELNEAIAKLPQQPGDVEPSFTPLSEFSNHSMALERMRKAHDDAAAFAHRETTWSGTAGTVLGTLVAGVSDPLQVATLPLGGAGTLPIALRALEFAAIVGGTEAVTAASNYRDREAAVPGSSKEIPVEIATATLFGGLMGGGIGGLQKLLGHGARPLPTSIRDEVNAAASEAQFNVTNPFPTAAGEAAARDATIEATTRLVKGEPVTVADNFAARHVDDFALAARSQTPEELAIAGEKHLRPETYGLKPDVEVFDRVPGAADDAASYWESRLATATPEERAALGATDGEQIRSAAIRYNGQTFEGALHSDAYEAAAQASGKEFGDVIAKTKPQDTGFVTSSGRFVDREEAARIANAAKQTERTINSLSAENLPDGYFGRRIEVTATDLTPAQLTRLAAEPATESASLHNLEHIIAEKPDIEFGVQVRMPDGSYQVTTRKLSDVLGEINEMEAAGKELEACVANLAQAAE